MNKTDALAEVKKMKGAGNPTAYFATLSQPKITLSENGLPDKLDEAHAEVEKARLLLSEQAVTNAKITVAVSSNQDVIRVEELLKAGKLTVPVANKMIELCEGWRADQMIHLAEGDVMGAQAPDQSIDSVLEMLGQLPQTVATEAAPADPNAAPVADPTANPMGGGDGGDADAQLDAAARQIMQKEGCDYSTALLKAQAVMTQTAPGGAV